MKLVAISRLRPILWIAGAYVLLYFALQGWRGRDDPVTLHPATPLDGTNVVLAEEWSFLWDVRNFIPPGASYTVLARDLSREETLYMMSGGLLPRAVPIPSSYWGNPHRWFGSTADYVIAFPCKAADRKDLRLVAATPTGCVFFREKRR